MRHKIFDVLLFLIFAFGLLQCKEATTSSPSLTTTTITTTTTSELTTTTTTSPFDVKGEMKKLRDFNDGFQILFESVYANVESNVTDKIGANFKKIMEASKKCGYALYQGLDFEKLEKYFEDNKNESDGDFFTLRDALLKKEYGLSRFCRLDLPKVSCNSFPESFYTDVKQRFDKSCIAFKNLICGDNVMRNIKLNSFKEMCNKNNLDFKGTLKNYIESEKLESTLNCTNYSDDFLVNLHNAYKNIIEHQLATMPMCIVYNNGIPSAKEMQKRGEELIEHIRVINKRLQRLNDIRIEKYWSKDNIVNIVKKYILGDVFNANANANPRYDNGKIAQQIYDDLTQNYKSLGFVYHVGISQTGTKGNVDTLIQCSTECHYFYNINAKDVYILRNKAVSSYKECEFLASKDNTVSECNGDRDSTYLKKLANQTQSNCNPTAFSLVRNRLNYGFKSDPASFSQKCLGDIYLAMAKNC